MNQYIREWSLLIDGEPYIESKEGANFRIIFDIDVSVSNAVSKADIRIYNLREDTGLSQGQTIQLKAGYRDKSDTIFSGIITNTYKERQGPDIATRILCRSGAALDNRGSANSTYGAGVRITEILEDLARQWPLALEIDKEQFKDDPPMSSGYAAQGDIPQALDSLASQFDFSWTQQLGALVIEKNDAERKTDVFDVNLLNGMVGMPEVTRGPSGMGVYVTTRLNPYIRVNSRINVQARFSTYNTGNQFWVENEEGLTAYGEYNVFRMTYEGDSHGDAWNVSIDGMRPGTATATSVVKGGALVWGAAVDQDFRVKVREIAQRQKLDPNWYMAIMAFETGGQFKASTRNFDGGSATGLIQFMPQTAIGLGTTTQKLSMMTEVQQLDYVEKYFDQYKSKIRSLSDMYMAVLWPVATSWPVESVIFDRDGSTAAQYRANSGLDKNGDGKITKKEAADRVMREFNAGIKRAK